MDVSKVIITMSNLFRVYIFKRDRFNKMLLMKFYYSSVYFCYLKCCTCVFGKPNDCCLCARSRIAISLIVFAGESDSLINHSVIF